MNRAAFHEGKPLTYLITFNCMTLFKKITMAAKTIYSRFVAACGSIADRVGNPSPIKLIMTVLALYFALMIMWPVFFLLLAPFGWLLELFHL